MDKRYQVFISSTAHPGLEWVYEGKQDDTTHPEDGMARPSRTPSEHDHRPCV